MLFANKNAPETPVGFCAGNINKVASILFGFHRKWIADFAVGKDHAHRVTISEYLLSINFSYYRTMSIHPTA